MPKIEPFDKHAAEYDAWFEKHNSAYLSELLAIRRLLPLNGRGIEIGVGTGRFAALLGVQSGIEPSTSMREIAKNRGIEVVGGVAEYLPFGDGRFDFVLMVTTLCFLDDIDAAFLEARRVLKRTGCFIIGFVDSDSLLGNLYKEKKKGNKFYRIADFHSVDEVISHLKRASFRNLNFVQTIFHPLNEIQGVETAINGYGQGSFVVVRAEHKV